MLGTRKTEHETKIDSTIGFVEGVVTDLKRSKDLILRKFEGKKHSDRSVRLKYLSLENLKKEVASCSVLEKLRNQHRGIEDNRDSLASNNLNMSRCRLRGVTLRNAHGRNG